MLAEAGARWMDFSKGAGKARRLGGGYPTGAGLGHVLLRGEAGDGVGELRIGGLAVGLDSLDGLRGIVSMSLE